MWKTAVKLLLQNWPIEIRALFYSSRKTWDCRAAIGRCGKGNIAMCVDYVVSTLGSLTEIPYSLGILLVQGLFGPMKWIVQPESTMSRLLLDGLRVGTRVLQENK